MKPKTLYYDIETTHQFAPYCELRMICCKEDDAPAFEVKTPKQHKRFRELLADPDVDVVTFNGCNFDNQVMRRLGWEFREMPQHDAYIALKTVCPHMPSFSQKFAAWWFLGDPHLPEFQLESWAKKTGQDKWTAPDELLLPYCLHDVEQLAQLWKLLWPQVQKRKHFEAYMIDLKAAPALQEMILDGGLCFNRPQLSEKIATLQREKLAWEDEAFRLTNGQVGNPNSNKQVADWLINEEKIELTLTQSGQFSLSKEDLADLVDFTNPEKSLSPVARCTYEVRRINATLNFLKNYQSALDHTPELDWIPGAWSLSNARTRRLTSSSYFKINFQNPNKEAKKLHAVPEGWLGWWIDSTQIENVVHIYESKDETRRRAYEADPDWNEYVWLCNQILGSKLSKAELDEIQSPQVSTWSVYKQYKTIKLALNFGMGIATFCKKSGLHPSVGRQLFDDIHEACPAIHRLQDIVGRNLGREGYVKDVFGHIYTGNRRKVYKVVAYLIQGTGTGSLPKAQFGEIYRWKKEAFGDAHKQVLLCGNTHDETYGRINLELGSRNIIATLQSLMHIMTDEFSHKFDGIPLRAKLYLSRTTAGEAQEVDINDLKTIRSFLK